MKLAALLDKLVPDLASTVARFPVPALLSILLCLYLNVSGISGGDDTGYVAMGAAAAFLAAGAAHLFAEGRGLSRPTGLLLALVAAAVAGLVAYLSMVFETHHLFLFLGLLPVVMVAPFLHDGARPGALWLFNLRLGLSALLASLVALGFGLGLSAIVEALNFLFEASLGSNLHEHIWGTAMSLVAPLYGLALMPRRLDEEVDIDAQRGTLLERGVSVLVNYVLVPVILVYALILHAYAVKIILQQALPKGQVATLVSIFAVGGTGAWLIAWPWREKGTRLLRWFMAGWFWLTIVPAILLTIAIWRRITDYGVTPDRYGIALIAVWIAAMTGYLAFRRNRADMRVILGALAVLLLVGAAGPMGAYGLTIKSQIPRFTALLAANGLMKDGLAVKPQGLVPSEVTTEGYSILSTLQQAGGLQRLRGIFPEAPDNPFAKSSDGWELSNSISAWLGFQNPVYSGGYVNFTAQLPLSMDIAPGSKLVGPMQVQSNYDKNFQQLPMTAIANETTLTVKLQSEVYSVPLEKFMKDIQAAATPSNSQPPLRVKIAPGAEMLIDNAYGNLGDKPSLSSLRFWLVVTNGV